MVVRVIVAIALAAVIALVGFRALRAVGGGATPRIRSPEESEDVADLDVFFVCRECGTELQVTRLGEAQVPRHCGEKMEVVRRPRTVPGDPTLN
jgi:hypothetical protein